MAPLEMSRRVVARLRSGSLTDTPEMLSDPSSATVWAPGRLLSGARLFSPKSILLFDAPTWVISALALIGPPVV